MNRVLLKSERHDWRTPKAFYEKLDMEFKFDFDPCPVDPDFNGLEIEWGGANFVNPPYKTKMQDAFIRKGFEEWKKGKTVVFLVPARTDTRRFHEIFLPHASEIRFIQGRLKFDEHKNPAPFPSMIVVFRREDAKKN